MIDYFLSNFAFIDGQNLYKSIQELGWNIDLRKFRIHLKESYKVSTAYYFIGYLDTNINFYEMLERFGYTLVYKEVMPLKDGTIKGNVDSELVLKAMIDFNKYQKAIIVSGDGDYACLVKYLEANNKLKMVIALTIEFSSVLLRRACKGRFTYLNESKEKLERIKKEAEPRND